MFKLALLLTTVLTFTAFADNHQRPEWRQKLDSGLDVVEKEIAELEVKTKDLSGKAKKEMEGTVSDLKKSRDDLKVEMEKASDKTKEKSKDYYQRFKDALAELEKGIIAARNKITKKQ